jgi:hypothetical protein
MANTSRSSTAALSQLIDELLDDLYAMPPLLHCRKCSAEVLYTNATFFMLAGKEWTVPVPHCPLCDLNGDDKGHPAAGRQLVSRVAARIGLAEQKIKKRFQAQ